MKYSLAELRKTGAAGLGTIVMVGAYLMENEDIKALLPPEWVAVIGALITLFGVFFVPNDRPAAEKAAAKEAVVAVQEIKRQVVEPVREVSETTVDVALTAVTAVEEMINRVRDKRIT